jgi:hypothetical protein
MGQVIIGIAELKIGLQIMYYDLALFQESLSSSQTWLTNWVNTSAMSVKISSIRGAALLSQR